MKFVYFVAFNYRDKASKVWGFGNNVASLDAPIDSGDRVRELEKYIVRELGYEYQVVVLNFIFLKTEEAK